MDPSKIEAVERLQAELINLQRLPGLDEGIVTLEADDATRQPSEMVAVGYGLTQNGDVTIQLRVRSGIQAVIQQAKELAEKAEHEGYQVNLLVLEKAAIPTRGEVMGSSVDQRMIDHNRVPHLGVSVSHIRGAPGSLGAYVYSRKGLAIVSASHVIARSGTAKVSDTVHRPGIGDVDVAGPRTILAELEDFTILTAQAPNTIDAAIGTVVNPNNFPKSRHNLIPEDFHSCPVRGKKVCQLVDAREVALGTRVGKLGRTTGYTEGVVTAVSLAHLAVTIPAANPRDIAFKNIIEVTPDDPEKPFSGPGDSGAMYFTLDDPPKAVAIHIIGGRREDGIRVSYGCHLQPALAHFGCRLSPD
jgi:hypothetical protein